MRSENVMPLETVKSQLLMPRVANVLRPAVGNAPVCARIYFAFGLFARNATTAPALFLRDVTSLLTPSEPAALRMVRSAPESPFRLESTPLCGVTYWGDSAV